MSIRQVILSEIVSGSNRELELKPITEEVYLYEAIPFAPKKSFTIIYMSYINLDY